VRSDPILFDVDVDLAPLLGSDDALLVSDRWYELLQASPASPPAVQCKIAEAFHGALWRVQWEARLHRHERRRAIRAPLLAPVRVTHGPRLTATDISLGGLRCCGRPTAGVLDVEFKLPGSAFPVSARAEVTTFEESAVYPLVGLRFVDIEPAYLETIEAYIDHRLAA
jgi:hypothetical protein